MGRGGGVGLRGRRGQTRCTMGNAQIANFSLRLSLPALASFRKVTEIIYHL